MAGIDPATGVAPDGIEAETEHALINLAAVLEAAGASMADGSSALEMGARRGARPTSPARRSPHLRCAGHWMQLLPRSTIALVHARSLNGRNGDWSRRARRAWNCRNRTGIRPDRSPSVG